MELTEQDFSQWDSESVAFPMHRLFGEMHDLVFHEMSDGAWVIPQSLVPATVPLLIEHARAVLDRLDVRIHQARAEIAAVERDARLRALNRARRTGRR